MKTQLLKNKIIVVIGGAGRIGQAFVRGILENGGRVVVADLNIEGAKRVATAQEKKFSGQSHAAQIDITNIKSITKLISYLEIKHGKIDAVVNSAYPYNKNYGQKLEDVKFSKFCQNINLHLGGYFLVSQQFCRAFKKQKNGNLINIASIYGSMTPRFKIYKGTSMTVPVEYVAIKSAIIQITRYFAQYFKGTGIRVNCLSPGGILADQPRRFVKAYNAEGATKGMLAVEDLVGSLVFLLSDESRYITGQNLVIDDGFSL